MIKYLSLLLLVLVLEGCNDDKQSNPSAEKVVGSGIGKIEVDHCEYVYYTLFGNAVSIVHAGNCHNPIHHFYQDSTYKSGDTIILTQHIIRHNSQTNE